MFSPILSLHLDLSHFPSAEITVPTQPSPPQPPCLFSSPCQRMVILRECCQLPTTQILNIPLAKEEQSLTPAHHCALRSHHWTQGPAGPPRAGSTSLQLLALLLPRLSSVPLLAFPPHLTECFQRPFLLLQHVAVSASVASKPALTPFPKQPIQSLPGKSILLGANPQP